MDRWEAGLAVGLREARNQDVLVHDLILALVQIYEDSANGLVEGNLLVGLELLEISGFGDENLVVKILLLHVDNIDRSLEFWGICFSDLVGLFMG